MNKEVVYMFQFQYGSIKRVNPTLKFFTQACFNSSMVRLKGYVCFNDLNLVLVSIPVWFD